MEIGNPTKPAVHAAQARPAGNGVTPAATRFRGGTVLALHAHALAHDHFMPSATAVLAELAQVLQCERVSLGFCEQGRMRVRATSDGSEMREQRQLVQAIAAAMDESLDQDCLVVHPLPRDSSPTVSLAHAELARVNGRASVCTVPVVSRGGMQGALLFERREAFDALALELAKDAASFVGPVLELKHRLEQPLHGRIVESVKLGRGVTGPLRWGAAPVVAGLLFLALGAAAFWPGTHRVVAPARVEGAGQRVIAAPVDGFVQAATLRPGEAVKAGQVLASIESRDLALERDKWTAEMAQLDKQYRDALSKDDAAQIVIARSKLEQVQAQVELVTRQLERASLAAPFDGVLLSGDLTQSVGMPVKRGQELMVVAPDKSFRVVAEVDEQDVAALREGQHVQVLFGAFVDRPLAATVTRIAPVATLIEGRNVFEVDGRIDATTAGEVLRPGLRGVARIEIEERSMAWIWWHRTSQWLQRTTWRFLG
jgi:biotin carboxyl carrier protein